MVARDGHGYNVLFTVEPARGKSTEELGASAGHGARTHCKTDANDLFV
jgi:hypothetical protein